MDKSVKVLMIVPNLRVSNGVASFAINYYRELDHDKVRMDFALISDKGSPYYKEIESNGNKVFILPPVQRKPIRHMMKCLQIIKAGEYDIVHDCVPLKSLPIMSSAKKYGVSVRILHSHSAKLGETKRKEKFNRVFIPFLRRTSTDFFACSDKAAEALFPNEEYTFVPNIIDSQRFKFDPAKRAALRNEMNVDKKIIVGTVGRPSPPKNPLFALDVMTEVIRQNPDVEYWWIGSGAMDDELRHGVAERHIEDNVRLLGSRDDVVDLYQIMDLFFLPSRFEGLPVTGVEAQAMGLPCVISDAVTEEMVYTDLVKYVGLDATVENWASTLNQQLKRIADRRSYQKELLQSPFSDKRAGENITTMYCNLLAKHRQ